MKYKPRKGLQDLRTHGSRTNDGDNPQQKFLRAASLELKKSLYMKVRDAARKRAEEMDRKIAELEAEVAQILASSQVSQQGETGSLAAARPHKGRGIAGATRLRFEVLASATPSRHK